MILFILGGPDRWDDRSHNRDYADREWEEPTSNTTNRYRDRSFDDEYDIEKEDSDTESGRNSSTVSTARRYKDNDTSPPVSEKRVNININSSAITNSPKKVTKTIKKVDLGAAANFGRDASQSPLPSTVKNDLLNDDFNPRADEVDDSKQATNEFGDFETAFGAGAATAKNVDEDFADFSSAFSANNVPLPHQTEQGNLFLPLSNNVSPQQVGVSTNLMGIGNNKNLMSVSQSNSDLLGGLSGFSGLSIQSQNTFGSIPNNNQGLLGAGSSLLDSGKSTICLTICMSRLLSFIFSIK